jgi:hypothetical protein
MSEQRQRLTVEDLSLVDLVLTFHPDFEIMLFLGIHAGRVGLAYPATSHCDVERLYPTPKKQSMFGNDSVLIAPQRGTLSQARRLPG